MFLCSLREELLALGGLMDGNVVRNVSEFETMTPDGIKRYLDGYVVEQEEAKLAMALVCWMHFCRQRLILKSQMDISLRGVIPDKSNILLYGPTGTGKTFILKTLAQILDVPFVHFDASTITAPGHKGEEAVRCIADLYDIAGGDIHEAERGIVFLDEIDKLAFHDAHGRGTKLSHSAQASLLRIIEGTDVTISLGDKAKDAVVNTSNVLFVAAGAFPGLREDGKREKRKVGFGDPFQLPQQRTSYQDYSKKFVDYGLTPELIGRFSHFVPLSTLSKDALFDVLTKTDNAIVKQYAVIAEDCGIRVTFPNRVLQEIVDEAVLQGTGARALRSVFERRFARLLFNLPTWGRDGLPVGVSMEQELRGALVSPLRALERNRVLARIEVCEE